MNLLVDLLTKAKTEYHVAEVLADTLHDTDVPRRILDLLFQEGYLRDEIVIEAEDLDLLASTLSTTRGRVQLFRPISTSRDMSIHGVWLLAVEAALITFQWQTVPWSFPQLRGFRVGDLVTYGWIATNGFTGMPEHRYELTENASETEGRLEGAWRGIYVSSVFSGQPTGLLYESQLVLIEAVEDRIAAAE